MILAGDLAMKHDNGAVFRVDNPAPEAARAAAFEISPTGPIFGHRMTQPGGVMGDIEREVLAADYLQTDDTSVTVLDDPTGSYKGRLWTYLDPLRRQVVFDATRTHERDGPEAFLADFRGKLQADAYTGYDALYTTVSPSAWPSMWK